MQDVMWGCVGVGAHHAAKRFHGGKLLEPNRLVEQ